MKNRVITAFCLLFLVTISAHAMKKSLGTRYCGTFLRACYLPFTYKKQYYSSTNADIPSDNVAFAMQVLANYEPTLNPNKFVLKLNRSSSELLLQLLHNQYSFFMEKDPYVLKNKELYHSIKNNNKKLITSYYHHLGTVSGEDASSPMLISDFNEQLTRLFYRNIAMKRITESCYEAKDVPTDSERLLLPRTEKKGLTVMTHTALRALNYHYAFNTQDPSVFSLQQYYDRSMSLIELYNSLATYEIENKNERDISRNITNDLLKQIEETDDFIASLK